MILSDYISELEEIRREHGDALELVDSENEPVGHPEYQDEYDDPCVVICDRA